jgi:hypothetical protein
MRLSDVGIYLCEIVRCTGIGLLVNRDVHRFLHADQGQFANGPERADAD